jgi:hypothetical protein
MRETRPSGLKREEAPAKTGPPLLYKNALATISTSLSVEDGRPTLAKQATLGRSHWDRIHRNEQLVGTLTGC